MCIILSQLNLFSFAVKSMFEVIVIICSWLGTFWLVGQGTALFVAGIMANMLLLMLSLTEHFGVK